MIKENFKILSVALLMLLSSTAMLASNTRTIIAQNTSTETTLSQDSLALTDSEAIIADTVALDDSSDEQEEKIDVAKIALGHIYDSYDWEITKIGKHNLCFNLPVILYSKYTGWHIFSFKRMKENGEHYKGFYISHEKGRYKDKIVENDPEGNVVRPLDLSLTKIAIAILINSLILLIIIFSLVKWYKNRNYDSPAPKGFRGAMEAMIIWVEDEVIKGSVGPNYKKFSPYLLTVFFFILINNLMSLIPFWPAGVDVTGNIAITLVLALFSFVIINLFGTKKYWKDIFWPDVPLWLKVPIPIMPFIEILGIFTKPFALMIRLFANMFAGHLSMVILTCLVFITASMGPVMNGSFTILSVFFNIFMNLLELLVAFIQAYIFTMLSAVFIGLAQEGSKKKEVKEIK